MDKIDRGILFLEKAQVVLARDFKVAFDDQDWNIAIRRAQESAEFALTPFSLPLSRAALTASAGAHCWAALLGGGWINYRGNFGNAVYGEAC